MVNGIRAIDPVDQIKDVVRNSMLAPKFDKKHRKKAGGHISRNVMNITIKIKTIRKPWRIEIIKLRFKNSDNEF